MIRRISRALALCSLPLAAGCGGELVSAYTLNLVPHTLTGQEPFANGREVEFVILHLDGTSEVYYAGRIEGGQLQADELPPVEAGASVGLLVEDAGGTPATVDIDLAVAWGSALVAEPLAAEDKTVTVDVLVAEIATIGDMGSLPAAKRSLGAGVAMVPGGDVYIFGGAAGSQPSDPPTDRIQVMANPDSGVWNFEKINATVPDREGIPGARYGMAAITVDVDGRPLIFVSGGRDDPGTLGGGTLTSTAAYLFDPATQKFTWGHKDSHETTTVGRSEHHHLLLDNGKVLIYGGWEGNVTGKSVEVFNPKTKRFDWLSAVTHGAAVPAAASLGPGGALVCGGGTGSGTVTPVDNCDTVTLGAVLTTSSSMPVPVMGHAMARLADGRILATGGITSPAPDLSSVPAVADAWIYNGTQWSTLGGTMKNPRAHHAIIPMPDGNAIILGGAANGGAVFPQPSPAVVCAELFDAKANTFTEIQPCSGAGGGASPQWSALADDGAFILAGEDALATTPAGDDFGFIAFTPAL